MASSDLDTHRRERLGELGRRCDFLEGERLRLLRLLALALEVATAGSPATPAALLGVLCVVLGTDPSRGFAVEEAEREAAAAQLARTLDVLKKTSAPERLAA